MKVVHLTASISRNAGGLFTSVRQLAIALQTTQGIDVQVIGLADANTEIDRSSWAPLEVSTTTILGPASFGYASHMSELLNSSRPDLVHSHGLWMYPSLATIQWARRTKRPYLVSPHGMLDPWALRNSGWKKAIASWLYENTHLRSAACLHALCEAEAEAFRAYGLTNPICIIPNGMNIPLHRTSPPPPWNDDIPADAKVLLFLGRIHPKKGLPTLLKAWATSGMYKHNWHLVIIGWDQCRHAATLQTSIRSMNIESSAHILGPCFGQIKHAAYCHADAFILPSMSEGLPMTILEVWSYRLPVLMTPQCNLPEGFLSGAALKIEHDPISIAKGITHLCSLRDDERRAMGHAGLELVARHFQWDHIAKNMAGVYRWIVNGGLPPACVRAN